MLHFAAQRGYILPNGSDMQINLLGGRNNNHERRLPLIAGYTKRQEKVKKSREACFIEINQPEMRTGDGIIQ